MAILSVGNCERSARQCSKYQSQLWQPTYLRSLYATLAHFERPCFFFFLVNHSLFVFTKTFLQLTWPDSYSRKKTMTRFQMSCFRGHCRLYRKAKRERNSGRKLNGQLFSQLLLLGLCFFGWGPFWVSLCATMLALRLDCSTAALATPQKV